MVINSKIWEYDEEYDDILDKFASSGTHTITSVASELF